MRRLLAPLLALALCAVAAPVAHAAEGTLVIVGRGPSETTVSLPRGVVLRHWPTIETKSPYALLAISQRWRTFLGVSWLAGHTWDWQVRDEAPLPGGAVTVRVLAEGPVSLRLPVRGMRGTTTVRTTRRLRGGAVNIREIPRATVDVIEDVIPFEVPRHSLLLHAVTRPGLRVASVEGICTTARGGTCGTFVEYGPLGSADWSVLHVDWGYGQFLQGDAYAFLGDATLFAEPLLHYLIWMPTA